MRITRLLAILILALPTAAIAQDRKNPDSKITVIYENDAHCTLPGYAKMATLKSQTLKETKNVLTVSGGDFTVDFMSRSTLGTKSQGAGIIQLMNAVGYDFIVPGNHDFDFGLPVLEKNVKDLEATTLCCNFRKLAGDSPVTVFPASSIREIDGVKIAFIGVATPRTMSGRNKANFSDADGNLLYTFCEETLFDEVQGAVDQARKDGADYVIVLSHLGDKQNSLPTSLQLIAGTAGIDVVLDAHAHSVIPAQNVDDKDGKAVLLTSTGLKFANIGVLTIDTDGSIGSKLVPTQDIEEDAGVTELIGNLKKEYGLE